MTWRRCNSGAAVRDEGGRCLLSGWKAVRHGLAGTVAENGVA